MSGRVSAYAGKRVLVTGGGGFIGRHLVRRLVDDGATVTTMCRAPQHLARNASPSVIRADIRDESAVDAAIAERFEFVFHLAAYSGQVPGYADHHESLSTNCLGLLNLLDAIRRLSPDTVLCFPSSRLVYGRTSRLPVEEGRALAPLSLYGIHKRAGEEYCAYYAQRWGLRYVALRLSNPYGPHETADHNRYNIANWMIDEIVRGDAVRIFGDGRQLRDYVYIDDAVDAMLVAVTNSGAHGRVYNIGSGEGVALVDFAREAIAIGGAGSVRFERWPEDYLRVETGDFVADISKIRDELGWMPRVSLRGGLARTIAAQRRKAEQRDDAGTPHPVAAAPREATQVIGSDVELLEAA
jgi:nucleoside-diphosphate-sugar epimerase